MKRQISDDARIVADEPCETCGGLGVVPARTDMHWHLIRPCHCGRYANLSEVNQAAFAALKAQHESEGT